MWPHYILYIGVTVDTPTPTVTPSSGGDRLRGQGRAALWWPSLEPPSLEERIPAPGGRPDDRRNSWGLGQHAYTRHAGTPCVSWCPRAETRYACARVGTCRIGRLPFSGSALMSLLGSLRGHHATHGPPSLSVSSGVFSPPKIILSLISHPPEPRISESCLVRTATQSGVFPHPQQFLF